MVNRQHLLFVYIVICISTLAAIGCNISVGADEPTSAPPAATETVPPDNTEPCTITNQMAHGLMTEPYGEGEPVTQLGPLTTSVATARTGDGVYYLLETPFGNGWIYTEENVSFSGNCEQLPIVNP